MIAKLAPSRILDRGMTYVVGLERLRPAAAAALA
jgi:hypothetical protein